MFRYKTQGTCSSEIHFEVKNGRLASCEIVDGCPGNTTGVARLVIGRPVDEVIQMLKGIPCRGSTSCPDQLARALEKWKKENAEGGIK